MGGTWQTQNKVRPGAYINVRSDGMNMNIGGERGVVTLPWEGGFGPVDEVIPVDAMTNTLNVLGYDLGAPEMLTLREALKRASRLLVYRVGGGIPAIATLEGLTITANHPGERGNDISVRISADINNEGAFVVETFIDTIQIESQSVGVIEDLVPNQFVTFSGTGVLTVTAGIELTGGTNTQPTAGDFADYFTALETHEFNVMALPFDDVAIKTLGVNYIQRIREDEGRKSQLAVAGVNADSEAVINLKNGVILADGTVIDANLATAWVAGATAGAALNESNTRTAYDGAVDVDVRYTHTEIVDALRNGEMLFIESRGRALVEQDINSHITFTAQRNQSFSKNRVIRVLDAISNNIRQVFEDNFIGRVTNNETGRTVFRDAVINYVNSLQAIDAVENFVADDVRVAPGEAKDAIVVDLWVQPTDAMEKLFMTVTVV